MYPNFSDSFTAFRQGRAEAFFNDSTCSPCLMPIEYWFTSIPFSGSRMTRNWPGNSRMI